MTQNDIKFRFALLKACDQNPEELENIWNTHNCIWLTVGSIMQQGCDILPKAASSRVALSVW